MFFKHPLRECGSFILADSDEHSANGDAYLVNSDAQSAESYCCFSKAPEKSMPYP